MEIIREKSGKINILPNPFTNFVNGQFLRPFYLKKEEKDKIKD